MIMRLVILLGQKAQENSKNMFARQIIGRCPMTTTRRKLDLCECRCNSVRAVLFSYHHTGRTLRIKLYTLSVLHMHVASILEGYEVFLERIPSCLYLGLTDAKHMSHVMLAALHK